MLRSDVLSALGGKWWTGIYGNFMKGSLTQENWLQGSRYVETSLKLFWPYVKIKFRLYVRASAIFGKAERGVLRVQTVSMCKAMQVSPCVKINLLNRNVLVME